MSSSPSDEETLGGSCPAPAASAAPPLNFVLSSASAVTPESKAASVYDWDLSRRRVLTRPDKSIKGTIDAPLLGVYEFFNESTSRYVSTSCCSGRLSVFCEPPRDAHPQQRKKGGKMVFVTHAAIPPAEAVHAILQEVAQYGAEGARMTYLKFEPFIVHVECRDLASACQLLTLATRECGLKQSGINCVGRRVVVGIRGNVRMEVPICRGAEYLVDRKYLSTLAGICNSKFEENLSQIDRFEAACRRSSLSQDIVFPPTQAASSGAAEQAVAPLASDTRPTLAPPTPYLKAPSSPTARNRGSSPDRERSPKKISQKPISKPPRRPPTHKAKGAHEHSNQAPLEGWNPRVLTGWCSDRDKVTGAAVCVLPSGWLAAFGGSPSLNTPVSDVLRVYDLRKKTWVTDIGLRGESTPGPCTKSRMVALGNRSCLLFSSDGLWELSFQVVSRHASWRRLLTDSFASCAVTVSADGSTVFVMGEVSRKQTFIAYSVQYDKFGVLHLLATSLPMCPELEGTRDCHLMPLKDKVVCVTGSLLSRLFIFDPDPQKQQWMQVAVRSIEDGEALPGTRTGFGCCAVTADDSPKGLLVLGGGISDCWFLSFESVSWVKICDLGDGETRKNCTCLWSGSRLVVWGGGTEGSFDPAVQVYLRLPKTQSRYGDQAGQGKAVVAATNDDLAPQLAETGYIEISGNATQSPLEEHAVVPPESPLKAANVTQSPPEQHSVVPAESLPPVKPYSSPLSAPIEGSDSLCISQGSPAAKSKSRLSIESILEDPLISVSQMQSQEVSGSSDSSEKQDAFAWVVRVTDKNQLQSTRELLEQQIGCLDKSRKVTSFDDGFTIPILSKGAPTCLTRGLDVRKVKLTSTSPKPTFVDRLAGLLGVLVTKWERLGDIVLLNLQNIDHSTTYDEARVDWKAVAELFECRAVGRLGDSVKGPIRESGSRIFYGGNGLTVHRESGVKYYMDVTRQMFASGNGTERARAATFPLGGETVVDLFCGIGYYSLPILVKASDKVDRVICCDWNPAALDCLKRSLALNDIPSQKVVVCEPGDSATAHERLGTSIADRVILGLIPESVVGFGAAACLLRLDTGGWLHVHHVCRQEVAVAKAQEFAEVLRGFVLDSSFDVRLTGSVGPAVEWSAEVRHIEKVKNYAPHLRHFVFDIELRPDTLRTLESPK